MGGLSDLTKTEHETLLSLLHESATIKLHQDLFCWLHGGLQYFLPHDILIAVSGDFDGQHLSFDVVSALPGIRTERLLGCNILNLSRQLHSIWLRNGENTFSVDLDEQLLLCNNCRGDCDNKRTIQGMKTVLAHFVHDERSNSDAMYLLMHNKEHKAWPFKGLFDLIVPHIDSASRRIASLPLASANHISLKKAQAELESVGISPRELEIIEWMTIGKTNYEIGIILNISAFTVKNHLQRIYKKLDVMNRVQAVAKMEFLTRSSSAGQTGPSNA